MWSKGINGWTFPANLSWVLAARMAVEAGFAAIEPVLAEAGELTLESSSGQCRGLGESIRAAGCEVTALASKLTWQTPFTSPDAQVRQRAIELTMAALDRARWLGAPVLLVVPGVVGRWNARLPEVGYADALHHAHDALRRLALAGEARRVVIAIENVWSRFLLSPTEMADLIDRVNSPWVRVYLDVGNVLAFGYPQDWIDVLGRRIERVHVKDYRLEAGTPQGFCPLGDGDVDWPAVMAALKRHRYQAPLIYEGPGELPDISRRMDAILAAT
ncbi:MAG: hypothetical protein AMXMBFR13_48550 [Phycisphaerae bacterium]